MNQIFKIVYLPLFIFAFSNNSFAQSKSKNLTQSYIFFLHNKFTEEHSLNEKHPDYGRSEYMEILEEFRKENFLVITEIRAKNTDVKAYANKVVWQIDSLLHLGVDPSRITVIGTSKGGYIAQYVSTYLANPKVNFVFIGSFQEKDLQNFSDINYCGNILTIYEKSDYFGVSAISRKVSSKLKINRFKEVELNTNLKHGFLFKPLKEWIYPCVLWANQDYDTINKLNKKNAYKLRNKVVMDTLSLYDHSRN